MKQNDNHQWLNIDREDSGNIPENEADYSISLEAEVPEVIFNGLKKFLSLNPEWDQYTVITSALADFLFINGSNQSCVTQHYLDSLFLRRNQC